MIVPFLFSVLAAGVMAALLTRLLRRSRLIAMDAPNVRSLHHVPTPRGGGAAIVTSIVTCGALGLVWLPEHADLFSMGWMLGLTLVVALFSLVGGDRHRFSAPQRLLMQVGVAVVWLWQTSAVFTVVSLPGLVTFQLGAFGWLVTVLFVVWTMNVFNFMDGMDGFAGSMACVGCAVLALLSYPAGHATMPLLAALASASALGFLLFNYPPASIFMGDVGSVALGFFVAGLVTLGARDGVLEPVVSALAFAPFFVDATMTLLKRAFAREPVWVAHRRHWYQRLVIAGWSHQRTLHMEMTLMGISGILAYLSTITSGGWLILAVAWTVPYLVLMLLVRWVEATQQPDARLLNV